VLEWVLLLWLVPAWFAQGFLALVFDWLPHHPHTNRERYRDTRLILVPGLYTLLLGQNLHLIHHLFPRLPFYRYSDCYAALRELLAAKGSPTVGSG
jgi:fatty acid desaturase